MIFLLLLLLVLLAGISWPWSAVLLLVAVVLEVVGIVILRRWSKRLDRRYKPTQPEDELVGATAEVVTPCRPRGQVRLRGETWEATCEAGADEGTEVRVDSVDGLEAAFAEARAFQEKVLLAVPDSARVLAQVAATRNGMGVLLDNTERGGAEALAHYQEAVALRASHRPPGDDLADHPDHEHPAGEREHATVRERLHVDVDAHLQEEHGYEHVAERSEVASDPLGLRAPP